VKTANRILFVHNGALGDFLCAWPGIFSIINYYQARQQGVEFYFSGKEFGLKWLEPYGVRKALPEMISGVEGMYLGAKPEPWLENIKVFWFCLKEPVSRVEHPNLYSLPVLDFQELDTSKAEKPFVISNLANQLNKQDIGWCQDWQTRWQDAFGSWKGVKSKQVGLIPGSGHVAKSWPLDKFEILARELDDAGYDPVYLLGPVEREREILPLGARAEYPFPPMELADRMLKMRAIIACDGGPAHLASHHGVPGLVLFGPVKWQSWAPKGLKVLLPSENCDCPPPVDDPKDITVSQAACISLIKPEVVAEAFLKEFDKPDCGG